MNSPDNEGMDMSLVRRYCPKFRVLIIGKANAGKTTILQKVCNTTENPTAVDTTGRRMSLSLLRPSAGRGQHDIEQGYVFGGRDDFVFHDSRGFEAGTTAELERAKAFIRKRSSFSHIKNRLHAVWYCIPSDTPRLLLEDETSFFEECRKGNVPVVAIFTKFDYRHKEAMAQLIEGGMDRPAARLAAPARAKEDFEAKYITRLYDRDHPPQNHVFVYDMHLPMTNCDQLIRATVDSLSDLSLKQLFVSTQRNRIHLYVGYSIEHVLENQQRRRNGLRRHEMKNIVLNCINWFPVNQRDLEIAVTKAANAEETGSHMITKIWKTFNHPWEHWWEWGNDDKNTHWSSQWIHEILFGDVYLEKMAGDGHRLNMAEQTARVATVTVVMLVFICDPVNSSMPSDEMQRRLKTFLETSAFDALIGDITSVLEMLRGEAMTYAKWTEELSKVVLSDQQRI